MSSNNVNIKTNNSGSKKLFGGTIAIIIIVILFFYIYSVYLSYNYYNKTSPYLIDGMTDASLAQQFDASQILQSQSSAYGTEFSYSFWMYINDTNFSANATCSETAMKHVLHRGSYDYSTTNSGSNSVNSFYYPLLQMPGVWLYPNTNKLNIRFNTYENVAETSDVGNIPLNLWVNIIIILIGGSVDVYVNGNLKKRTKLQGVPKINYGDLYVTNWGGYLGFMSNLKYFNYAIQPYTVDQIYRLGPNTNMVSKNNASLTNPAPQLSANYWMNTGYPNSVGYPGYNSNST